MPIETDKPGFKPSDFNLNWPLRADLLSQGDDHLRLIKKAAQTLQVDVETAITVLQSYFDLTHNPVAAKLALKALEADTITGVDFSKFALKDGDYSTLRARATTAEDVGLDKVENFGVAYTLTDSDELYVRASMLNSLYNVLLDEIRKRQPPDLSKYALKTGDYQNLRARATTKEDVNLENIENYPLTDLLEDDDQKYASAKAVYTAKTELERLIASGAANIAQSSGADSDLKSVYVGNTGGTSETLFRTFNLTVPSEELVWKISGMKFLLEATTGTGEGTLELVVDDGQGTVTTFSSDFKSTGTNAKELVTSIAPVFKTKGVGAAGSYKHTVTLKGVCKRTVGTDTLYFQLSYNENPRFSGGLVQYSVPSTLLTFS